MEKKSQSISKVYLDFNATAPVAQKVQEQASELLKLWGNPSSIHWAGQSIKTKVREARRDFSSALHASPLELIFNSGASESNNTVLLGLCEMLELGELPEIYQGKDEFVSTSVEHPSTEKALQQIEKRGFQVHRLKVDQDGNIDLKQAMDVISSKTLLVSVMLANNETGSIFPVREIKGIAEKFGALVHTDAVQALGKMPINLQELGVDYASFSGHKIGALKGIGILFVKKGRPFSNLIFGGGQERYRRGGTENTMGIASLGLVTDRLKTVAKHQVKMSKLRDQIEARIKNEISGVQIIANSRERLANTSSMFIDGVDGETLLMSLDLLGFAVSTGAACSSGNPEPSPVLLNMGFSRRQAQSSLRVSLGWESKDEDAEQFVEALKTVVARLRAVNASERKPSVVSDSGQELSC